MWNDGYSKEQPWLNYFNSYERMHCCFDGDGGDDDDGGAGDEAASTSGGTGASSSTGDGGAAGESLAGGAGTDTMYGGEGSRNTTDVGAADDEAANTSGGPGASSSTGDVGAADDEAANTSGAAFEASYNTGAGKGASDAEDSGMTADQAAEVAAAMDAAAAAGASVEGQQAAGDVAAADLQGIDISQVDSGVSKANPSLTDIETLEALGIIGYNDKVSLGYFEKAAAEDYAKSKAEAAALEASYKAKGKDVSISVAKDGTYSYTGKDAGTVGLSEMGKGAGLRGEMFGVGSVIGGLGRAFGTTGEKDTGISMVTGGQNYGGLREEGISSQQEKDSRGTAGPSDSGATLASDFDAMQQQADFDPTGIGAGFAAQSSEREELEQLNDLISAYEDAEIGRSDTQLDRDISAYGEADEAMFGGNYAGQQNEDETFGEDETDEGVQDTGTDTSIPILELEEKEPETAMEAYFRKLGIASPAAPAGPVAPSSFQQYSSYLPPIGPADNAAYRRKLALGTPRYQEPSGPNPSISTLAAVYGLTYEEAAKKFAFPSVPKPPSLPVLTTFAASGGGLNSLMRYK